MPATRTGPSGPLADWVISGLVARDLERALRGRGRGATVKVDLRGPGWPNDFLIKRQANGYRVAYSPIAHRHFVVSARHFLRAYLYWMDLTGPAVRSITVNGSDGQLPSEATFAASARPDRHISIPDPHFFVNRGFARERGLAATAPAWDQRSDDIVWRGLSNGAGRLSLDVADADDPTVIPRLRLCMKLRDAPGCDVRIAGILDDRQVWTEPARQRRLAADPVAAESWLGRKYAIDIDGNTNTWSNFLVRMLFGCCVLKVDSQLGFRQWYYDRLRPFEHYIPVRADMADLHQKIDWARSHQIEARAIAEAGQRIAMGLDFEAGKRDAVDIITANWDRAVA